MSIEVKGISKLYGKQKALYNVSFSVGSGEVVGFLGPNGAGKSTMMKILTCFIPQNSGEANVLGYDVLENSIEVRKNVGYLPESNPLYYDMYVREYLKMVAGIYKFGKKSKERVEEMIAATGLTPEAHKKIGALSKGYKQRVGLAQAIIHDPKVLILDEPTSGLDPNQLQDIRELIINLGKDKTVILSTHIMQEVEAICNRVIIINKGEIVADDKTNVLLSSNKGESKLIVEFKNAPHEKELLKLQGVKSVSTISETKYKLFTTQLDEARSSVFRFAVDTNNEVLTLNVEEQRLEDIFQKLTVAK
ncbi:MAG: gliding motility-associated ABC transporter ATP-binding subunit GldA [Bacteroidia bacterium]|nr:gliding motility-associated ABC transporter ATP-binding subunit GldA [Bacteroidia bacterium]